MRTLNLMSLLVSLFSLSTLAQTKLIDGAPQYTGRGILLEANDAGESIEIPYVEWNERERLWPTHHRYFHFRESFESVTQVITPEVEDSFDVFLFANVSYEKNGSANDLIPSQRMRIYRKKNSGERIFNRNIQGEIISSNPVSAAAAGTSDHDPALPGFPGEILVSSGASQMGATYVDTFSGVFRLNAEKSRTNRHGKGMIHSLYIDLIYPKGRISGVAVHGTPESNYKYLGTQASHGCVRIHQDIALPLYEYAMGEALFEPELLDFPRQERLPLSPLPDPRPGQKVLMIFFYGYDGNPGLDI